MTIHVVSSRPPKQTYGMNILGDDALDRKESPQTFEDTSFVDGDSPATLDINAALGRNATEFTVINDGAGNFTVALSQDGTIFGDEHTMKNGETYSLEKVSVDKIRITHVADSAYRVIAI